MAAVTCGERTAREINAEIRRRISGGETDLAVSDPRGRHNLAVGLIEKVTIRFAGSVGYYCGGMIDGPTVEIEGSAGWGLGESMMGGLVVAHGNAGNAAGAAMRGGTVVIHGDAAARTGVSMKGGLLIVGGDCGYMAGFMGQKGRMIVCGDTGEAFADSMYETICFVGGRIAALGNDAEVRELTPEDRQWLTATLPQYLPEKLDGSGKTPEGFQKVVAGQKLWRFDRQDWKSWKEAL